MRRKSVLRRPGGNYAGLTLAEWRGTIAALRSSGWWVFGATTSRRQEASTLHYAVVQACALLLPTKWHAANTGRFGDDWYRARRGAVNARATFLRPHANQGGPNGTLAV